MIFTDIRCRRLMHPPFACSGCLSWFKPGAGCAVGLPVGRVGDGSRSSRGAQHDFYVKSRLLLVESLWVGKDQSFRSLSLFCKSAIPFAAWRRALLLVACWVVQCRSLG